MTCKIHFLITADTILRVRMWNGCASHLQSRLVSPISGSRHDRIVKELQISASMWFSTRSSSCTPPFSFPPGCVSSCERMDGFKKAEKDAVREDDTESPSSFSSLCGGEASVTFPPVVQLRRKEQRPPWRYWRRTGAEPQHKQPGGKTDYTLYFILFIILNYIFILKLNIKQNTVMNYKYIHLYLYILHLHTFSAGKLLLIFW